MNTAIEQLKSCAAFASVEIATLKDLAVGSQVRSFTPRQPVYLAAHAADSLCLLLDGRVALGHVTQLGKRSMYPMKIWPDSPAARVKALRWNSADSEKLA